MKSVGSLLLAFLLVLAPDVHAQGAPQRGYIQGQLLLTVQQDGVIYYHTSPPLGGSAFPGVSASAGVFVRPSLAIEGEVFVAPEVSVPQSFSYSWSDEYVAGFSVTTLNALLRWKPRGRSPVELVVGGGPAWLRYEQRDGVHIAPAWPGPAKRTALPDRSFTQARWTIKGGADLVHPLASRVALAAGVRVRWRQGTSQDYFYGVGTWSLDAGAGLRVRF